MDTEQDLNRREQKIRRLNGGKTYDYIKNELLPDQRNSGYLPSSAWTVCPMPMPTPSTVPCA